MLNVESHGQQLVAQVHVDDSKVDKHHEVEVRVLAVIHPAYVFGESYAVGSDPEIVVVFPQVRLGVRLGLASLQPALTDTTRSVETSDFDRRACALESMKLDSWLRRTLCSTLPSPLLTVSGSDVRRACMRGGCNRVRCAMWREGNRHFTAAKHLKISQVDTKQELRCQSKGAQDA